MTDFEIVVRRKNGTNVEIYSNGELTRTGIKIVNDLNKEVVEYIMSLGQYERKIDKTIYCGDIKLHFFTGMFYRGCTVYLAVQTSNSGERILAYISTKRTHTSSSFGTIESNVTNNAIIKFIDEFFIKNGIDPTSTVEKVGNIFGI